MALKLHCSKCHKFIKEVTPSEASHLDENVVCQECVDTAYKFRDMLEAEYKKLNSKLGGEYNKAMVKLEDIIHKALE
ncbi:MAG: hypothetical protein ACFFCW_00275 [Candidatus Hodarchaeota archaeon]